MKLGNSDSVFTALGLNDPCERLIAYGSLADALAFAAAASERREEKSEVLEFRSLATVRPVR